MSNCKALSAEYRDSVEDFIKRHNIEEDDDSSDNIRRLEKEIQSIKAKRHRDVSGTYLLLRHNNKFDKNTNCKVNQHYEDEVVSKVIKYVTKLNQMKYKLMQEIKKEKQNRELKRFISLLRDKHKCDVQYVLSQNDLMRTSSKSSDTCNYKLLSKLYSDLNDMVTDEQVAQPPAAFKTMSEHYIANTKDDNKATFVSNLICYPTSSCKPIDKLQREMGHTNLCAYLSTTVNMNKDKVRKCENSGTKEIIKAPSTLKTDHKAAEGDKNKLPDSKLADIGLRHTEMIDKVQTSENDNQKIEKGKPNYLLNIEAKVDDLVSSINLLSEKIKLKQVQKVHKQPSTADVIKENSKEDKSRLENSEIKVIRKQYEGVYSDSLLSVTKLTPQQLPQLPDEIVKLNKKPIDCISCTTDKETNTKNKVSFAQNRSVGLMVRVLTSEKAVEVNRPFAKTEFETTDCNKEEDVRRITLDPVQKSSMAANTEPLSVLALLRVSTATIRQLLSSVPAFDYYSYLPLFQSPGCNGSEAPHYVCNICGADFDKASKLNDHIKGHDLGFVRNCCVCQHVLNLDSIRSEELFKCRFCGQRFTRAYCCELHQQSCAKRLGVPTEVASGLILLR